MIMDMVHMDTIDHMPEEVVTQILVRLPVKCLLKFRCVCKAWFALIRSPHFIDMHLHNNNNKTDYLLLKRSETMNNNTVLSSLHSLAAPDSDYDFPAFPHRLMDIAGPCNGGIVCLADCSGYLCNPFIREEWQCRLTKEDAIYLCNPATRESWRLPDRPFGFPHGFLCQRHGFALGFDSRTNEYKVLSILFFLDIMDSSDYRGHYKIEMYNSNSNSWREAHMIMPPRFASGLLVFTGPGVFLNGRFHWCTHTDEENLILYLDMMREDDDDDDEVLVFQEMPYPPAAIIGHEQKLIDYVVELEDSLALIQLQIIRGGGGPTVSAYEITGSRIVIWVMMDYGVEESWMKRFCIGPFTGGILGVPSPLAFWNGDKLLIKTCKGELASCDLLLDLDLDLEGSKHHHYNIYRNVGCGWMGAVIMQKESLANFPLLRRLTDNK